ncbi:MAG TPA: hypothetical protein VGX03_15505 [Candidatus Binatia bacterium]|nr:hypothetical protein [Candidatus Binatia bacterium]
MNRQPAAHTPRPAGTHDPPHTGSTAGPGPHQNTTTGKPRPTASAISDQEPDAGRPQRQDRAGTTPAGQGPATKATQAEPGPAAAHARTHADARAGSAPRPANEGEKTTAPGQAERTNAEAPAPEHTATPRPARATATTTRPTRPDHAELSEREPPKPTRATGTPLRKKAHFLLSRPSFTFEGGEKENCDVLCATAIGGAGRTDRRRSAGTALVVTV